MSKSQTLRGLINQRLSAAAEEIFELFERTIAEYEEQLCRSKEENERQQKLLEAVYKPEVRLHRAVYQQLLVKKEEVPSEQQERSHSLDQVDPPKPAHIKEEQEELWTQQHLGEPKTEIIQFTLSPVHVKSEDDEGKNAQSLEADGETEPDRNYNPDESDEFTSDWEETSEPQSGLNPASEKTRKRSFVPAAQPQIQDEDKEDKHSCSFCGKTYPNVACLKKHRKRHTERKRFSCSVCKRTFPWNGELIAHMRTHTKEKPFSCSICGASFTYSSSWAVHLKSHSGEKPFKCSICGKKFGQRKSLNRHSTVHTGEKRFKCPHCNRGFTRLQNVQKHKCPILEYNTDE